MANFPNVGYFTYIEKAILNHVTNVWQTCGKSKLLLDHQESSVNLSSPKVDSGTENKCENSRLTATVFFD